MKYNHDEVLKIAKQKLKYLNYSDRTNEIYCHYIGKFLNSIEKYSQHITADDFQNYLNTFCFSSISQQNQIINAIKFLYEKVLGKKYSKVSFERPKREKHLPQIIDKNELLTAIGKVENLKHKAIIMIAYSVGLRVSEIINLKITDIDSKRMIIFIENGKGRKDRIVPLSENVLALLRDYFKAYKPKEYLFNGQNSLQYSTESCNQIVKKYINSKYHFHLLRHSCFTHLIENGIDCRIIQKIAGHSNIKTTEGYMQVSTNVLKNIQLPI